MNLSGPYEVNLQLNDLFGTQKIDHLIGKHKVTRLSVSRNQGKLKRCQKLVRERILRDWQLNKLV